AVLVMSFRLPLQDARFAGGQCRDFPLEELADDDSAGDHRQVSGQAASTPKTLENGKVVRQNGDKNFGCEVFPVLLRNLNRAGAAGMVDDMDHQTDKPVYEVLPCAGLTVQAA